MEHTYVKRIFSVLDNFSAKKPELGVREMARLIDLSPSTCGRILSMLRDEGVLNRDPISKQYRLSGRVLHWAGSYRANSSLNELALPYMQSLLRQTDETISLYSLEEDRRVCINRLEGNRSVRIVEAIGQPLELYTGSGGRAILAYLPKDEIERIVRNAQSRAQTEINLARLNNQLETVRKVRYALSHGEWMADASGVAIPVMDPSGRPIGSISVSGPTSRLSDPNRLNEIIDALLQVRQRLETQTGLSGSVRPR